MVCHGGSSSFPSHVITYKKPLTGHSRGIRLAYWAYICLHLCWKLRSPFIHMICFCRCGRLPVAFVTEMQRTAGPKAMYPLFLLSYSLYISVSSFFSLENLKFQLSKKKIPVKSGVKIMTKKGNFGSLVLCVTPFTTAGMCVFCRQ